MPQLIETLPKQHEVLMADDEPFLGVMGGLGCSKTRTIAMYCLHMLKKHRGIWGALASGTYRQLVKSADAEFRRYLAERDHYEGKHFTYSAGDMVYRFRNGSQLHLLSMNISPGEIKGPQFGFLVLDEADTIGEDHWKMYKRRAREPGTPKHRRVFGNGAPPAHWFARDFTGGSRKPGHRLIHMSSYENRRYLGSDEIAMLEDDYPPGTLDHDRWVLGKVVALQGSIYPEFDPSVHVIDEDQVPEFAGYLHGLDFGTRDPNVLLVGGVDRLGNIYILGEYYSPENTAIQALNQEVRELRREIGSQDGTIYSDHSATARAGLEFEGTYTELADKDVYRGIDCVRRRFRQRTLFIVRGRAPMLEKQLQLYIWKQGRTAKEAPEHKHSHAPDALRYLVMGLDSDADRRREWGEFAKVW